MPRCYAHLQFARQMRIMLDIYKSDPMYKDYLIGALLPDLAEEDKTGLIHAKKCDLHFYDNNISANYIVPQIECFIAKYGKERIKSEYWLRGYLTHLALDKAHNSLWNTRVLRDGCDDYHCYILRNNEITPYFVESANKMRDLDIIRLEHMCKKNIVEGRLILPDMRDATHELSIELPKIGIYKDIANGIIKNYGDVPEEIAEPQILTDADFLNMFVQATQIVMNVWQYIRE